MLLIFALMIIGVCTTDAIARPHAFSSESTSQPIRLDSADHCALTLRELSAVTIVDVSIRSFDGACRGYADEPFVRTCVRPRGLVEVVATIALATPTSRDVRASLLVHSTTADWNGEVDQFSSLLLADTSALITGRTQSRSYVFRAVMTARTLGVYQVSVTAVHECGWTLTRTTHRQVEVTCSDGKFCNGAETFANGACVDGRPPCDDDDECTIDQCNDVLGLCMHEANNDDADCGDDGAMCAGRRCEANCSFSVCGSDGCGGLCGRCANGMACFDGRCAAATYDFSCERPRPLNVLLTSSTLPSTTVQIINPQTTMTANEVGPSCIAAGVGGARDYIFTFVVPYRGTNVNVGIDAILRGRTNESIDTVLEIRKDRCYDADTLPSNDSVCNDNGKPHGGVGSRISALLAPGLYYLIASTVQEYSPVDSARADGVVLFPSVLP